MTTLKITAHTNTGSGKKTNQKNYEKYIEANQTYDELLNQTIIDT